MLQFLYTCGSGNELAHKLVDFYLNWLEANPSLHDKVEFEVVPTCYSLFLALASAFESGQFENDEIDHLRRLYRVLLNQQSRVFTVQSVI